MVFHGHDLAIASHPFPPLWCLVHPCFRSPLFIRCIGALILIVALPLSFLLVDRCLEGMANSSWGHGSFATLIRKYRPTLPGLFLNTES